MKCLFILAIQCILSSAVATPKPSVIDTDGLKRVLAKYQAMTSLEVPFKQTKTLKDIQLKLESEGILKVRLPNTVEWKIIKPQPLVMLLEQDKITLTNDGNASSFKLSEGSAKDQRAFHDLLNWLRLDAEGLLKDYDVIELARNNYRFEAKKPETGMKALVMKVNKSGHVEDLIFEEIAGDEISIHFGSPRVTYAGKTSVR